MIDIIENSFLATIQSDKYHSYKYMLSILAGYIIPPSPETPSNKSEKEDALFWANLFSILSRLPIEFFSLSEEVIYTDDESLKNTNCLIGKINK
jgi:hypothetical protein